MAVILSFCAHVISITITKIYEYMSKEQNILYKIKAF